MAAAQAATADYQAWAAAQQPPAFSVDSRVAKARQVALEEEAGRLRDCVKDLAGSAGPVDRFMRIVAAAEVTANGFGSTGVLSTAGAQTVREFVPEFISDGHLLWDSQMIAGWFLEKTRDKGIAAPDRFSVVVADRWRSLTRGDPHTKAEPPMPAWRFDNMVRMGTSQAGGIVLLNDGRLLKDNGHFVSTPANKLELLPLKMMTRILRLAPGT